VFCNISAARYKLGLLALPRTIPELASAIHIQPAITSVDLDEDAVCTGLPEDMFTFTTAGASSDANLHF